MKNKNSLAIIISFLIGIINPATSQAPSRWSLANDGSIKWEVKEKDTHMDHVEMSGLYVSGIVHYGVEKGELQQKVHLVFPMLRTIPNDTHASLAHTLENKDIPNIKVNGKKLLETPHQFSHKGILSYESKTTEGLEVKHQLFPSADQPAFIDKVRLKNTGYKPIIIELPKIHISHTTDKDKGVTGAYIIELIASKAGSFELKKGESLEYALIYSARSVNTDLKYISADYELCKREDLINKTFSDLQFESPDDILNKTFTFAKLRAVESIFATKGGLMHAPGGGRYYAAIWANDQAEYANPFFPFLGNLAGNESAINSFRHFARFMNDDFKPIPSSIIAEGLDFWNGAGDRGDMAMIAYGAARFALAYADQYTAKELWPLIEWCLEFCRRKVTVDGVVASDSDELEGRFPAGKTNLNTSCLYYDALVSAVLLGKALGIEQEQLVSYEKQSRQIKQAIEKFFGATMEGFETFRYYEENELLRAWIATPLTVDIFDRSKGTVDALFSDKLWTEDGLASEAGSDALRASMPDNLEFLDLPADYQSKPTASLRDESYCRSDFDDSSWGKVNLPAKFEHLFSDIADGVFWFRKEVNIEDLSSDYSLLIDGGIDDMDQCFVNGQKIGSTACWNCPREYNIPKSMLVKGLNSISIRAIDLEGGGSIAGNMLLKNASRKEILISGEWRCLPIGEYGNNKVLLLHSIPDDFKDDFRKISRERKKALFSDDSEITTFWDRATLYAFRGALAAGETKRTIRYLKDYSERRLLGEHVPYPVEAYPEGNQRHLSAESALYCRVITEGLFGIRPTGFSEFSFTPQLPEGWNEMALRNIKAFNRTFDIEVKRNEKELLVKVFNGEKVFLETTLDISQSIKCQL